VTDLQPSNQYSPGLETKASLIDIDQEEDMHIEQWFPDVEPFTNSISDAEGLSEDQELDSRENPEAEFGNEVNHPILDCEPDSSN